MGEFAEAWAFIMEIMADIPKEIAACGVVVDEGKELINLALSMDWGAEITTITTNVSTNLITISSLGMGMMTMAIGKNYYEAGKDFGLLIKNIVN